MAAWEQCRRWLARLAVVLASALALLLLAAPAQAHNVGGVGATNFRTTISAVTPAVSGLTIRVIENGSRLELRNATSAEVIIAGYGGEPYARVGPAGVFLNDNSPATYLNQSRFSTTAVPGRADPAKPPSWRQVSDEPLLRWHDHRIHWMLSTLPPVVSADLDAPHQISAWTIQLTYEGAPVTVTGTLDWVPGPNPWPWFALVALLIAVTAAVPLLVRPHRALAAIAFVGVGAAFAHGLGAMLVEGGSIGERLGALFGPDALLVWPFAFLAAWFLGKGHTRALWVAAATGLAMAATLVIDDAPDWWRSSSPTALPLTLNRLLVALAVGAGLGLVAALPLLLRRHPPPTQEWSVAQPAERPGQGSAGVDEPVPAAQAEPDDDEQADDEPLAPGPAEGEPIVPALARSTTVGRRQVAGALAAGALGALAGAAAGATFASPKQTAPPSASGPPLADVGARRVAFYGEHQPGIVTPNRPQARCWVAGLDLAPTADHAALTGLLRRWTNAAAALMAGTGLSGPDDAVVAGLGPAALTITVGFGPSLFGRAGIPASARPKALAPLPDFPGDAIDRRRSDGDLGLIVAADDPVVVAHAARVLVRMAKPVASVRWQLSAFNAARGNGSESATPRNLMGQVDGTNNPKPTDADFTTRIFASGPDWLRGGSFLVVRRIRMLLDDWDTLDLAAQERVIGRRKADGAPLSGGSEFTPPNYGARTDGGDLAIPEDAHIRLATPAFNGGAAMLRRGFSYADETGSGLLFLAWQADPRHGFVPVQRRLASADALSRFIRHESSALFAAPAGVGQGEFLGQGLLEG